MQDITKLDMLIADYYGLKAHKWYDVESLAEGVDATTSNQDGTESVTVYYRSFITDKGKRFILASYAEELKFHSQEALDDFDNCIVNDINTYNLDDEPYYKCSPNRELHGYLLLSSYTS